MSTTTDNNILGQYEKSVQAVTGTSDRVATDKDTFLKLLVAQLTHQDPLNPVEDKEFIAQLAQFTSVEELQKINKGIEGLNASYTQQQVSTAANFIGMEISAKGDTVTLKDGYCSPVLVTFPRDVETGTVNVYSTDAAGNIGSLVYSETMGAAKAGQGSFVWTGKTANGATCPNGTYVVTFAAKDYEGESMMTETSSSGTIIGVKTSDDGNHYLYLQDGRKVRLNDVQLITYPTEVEENTDGE